MLFKELAEEIGITRQELRQELQKTNFGVDVSTKEVPDGLALGIIRVLGPKFKKQKAEMMKRMKLKQEVVKKVEKPKEEMKESKSVEKKITGPIIFNSTLKAKENRKIFKEKEEAEKKEREVQAKKRDEEALSAKDDKTKFKKKGKQLNITRKIEFDSDNKRKKKNKKGDAVQHHKSFKRFKANSLNDNDLDTQDRLALIAEEEMRKQLEDEAFKAAQNKRNAKRQAQKKKDDEMVKKEGVIEIPVEITVKEFSEKTGVGVGVIVATLLKNGVMATMNTQVDFDTWLLISDDLSVKIEKEDVKHSVEDIVSGDLAKLLEEDNEKLSERPPMIVVMGHVDHGKTSILDFYRSSTITEGEAGGITQHIGAYQVEKNNKQITFVDTPGHEAFTSMRARGTKVADIAILVVAADEGIKEQTKEAYNHAKEAGVPIIVAINKIDKEGANIEKIKGDLMTLGLTSEDYGGETMMMHVSAKKGDGMSDLLDAILLQAEVLELKANPNRAAIATVVESHLDKSLGPVATVIINTGTLHKGDIVLAGSTMGKVRTLLNSSNKREKFITPSGVAQITGFEQVPEVGEIVQVVSNDKEAKERLSKVLELKRGQEGGGLGMNEIMSRIASGKMNILKVVLKADTQGSIEAIKQMFAKIDNQEVGVQVIHSAVGNITESDVIMASASQGLVVGFNVKSSVTVDGIAAKEKVEVQIYDVIYNLMNDISQILTGMLKKEEVEVEIGKAEVRAIFLTSKKKKIIGCKVINGVINNKSIIKVVRDQEEMLTMNLSNLRSFDKNVDEVKADNECGLQFNKNFDFQEGDILMCYKLEQKMKTL